MTIQRLIVSIVVYFVICNCCWSQSPNIVFIFIDDQGWNGTSHQMDSTRGNSKSDYYQTPHVAGLAQQGMTFSQAYAPAPKCSPSRNSILTGQTTAKSQFTNTTSTVNTSEFLLEPMSASTIEATKMTFAELVKQSNPTYQFAHYGKWHLGSGGPESHGFDRSDGNTSNLPGQGTTTQTDPKLMFEITDSALTFIQDAQTAGRPFYVQLSHYAVHSPSELRPATLTNLTTPGLRPIGTVHKDTLFGGMTEDVDVAVGLLLDSLTAWGLDSNTYVVYMSDNGASAGTSKNTPLSRGKIFLKEGGIRVPLIIRGPNVPMNSYNTVPVIGYDLYPTFVDWMLGTTMNVPANVEGSSLMNLANGTTQNISRNNSLIFHSPHYDMSPNKRPESAIRNDSFKFMVDYELGEFYLYDLINDVEENTDLKSTYPALTKSLCLELRDYLKGVGAAMPSLNPSHSNNSGPVGDYDNDGLDDAWEFRELLTHIYDGNDDPDGDGLNNATEFMNNTDPHTSNVSSIAQTTTNSAFNIFPNPSSSQTTIEGNLAFDKIYLYDYTGRKLLQKTRKTTLNVSKLLPGIYFLVIKNEGQIIYTEEISIQR